MPIKIRYPKTNHTQFGVPDTILKTNDVKFCSIIIYLVENTLILLLVINFCRYHKLLNLMNNNFFKFFPIIT